MKEKIKSLSGFKKILGKLRSRHKTVVFTNGCFDLLHRGHIDYLKKAKSLGDILIIGLNSDASVRRLKGPARPINTQADRAQVLASLGFVDFVIIFNEDTPYYLISQIRPDILVKGADWKKDEIIGGDVVRSYGGKISVIKYLSGYSTTNLLNKIAKAVK